MGLINIHKNCKKYKKLFIDLEKGDKLYRITDFKLSKVYIVDKINYSKETNKMLIYFHNEDLSSVLVISTDDYMKNNKHIFYKGSAMTTFYSNDYKKEILDL